MSVNELNTERYLLHEMRANGIVEWEGGDTFIWEGESQDYAVEVRCLPLGKRRRLMEDWCAYEQKAENVQISITMLDEYGLPMERRGVKIKQPKPHEAKEFSDNVADMVRDTLYELFKVES